MVLRPSVRAAIRGRWFAFVVFAAFVLPVWLPVPAVAMGSEIPVPDGGKVALLAGRDGVPPLPGQLLVENELALGSGACIGGFSVRHAPLAASELASIMLTVQEDCAVAVSWIRLSSQVANGDHTDRNVSATYLGADSEVFQLAGLFASDAENCPSPSAAADAQSPGFVPGWGRDENDPRLPNNEPQPPTSGVLSTSLYCDAYWVQKWQTVSYPATRYFLQIAVTRMFENAIRPTYVFYSCKGHAQTMENDWIICWDLPSGVTSPSEPGSNNARGTPETLMIVKSGTEKRVDMPPMQ